jgi:hypothetical protein
MLAAILLAGLAGVAQALTFKNIAGKWCGQTTNYEFSADALKVTFLDGSPDLTFKITGYDYSDDTVAMRWHNQDKPLFTEFSEFSADGKTMAQVKSDVGPRRPFHRC